MKFFDWKCYNCNTVKEYYEKFNNDPHICEKCGTEMKRIITSPPQHNFKNLPPGHNLSATKRRELWNSRDSKDVLQLTN